MCLYLYFCLPLSLYKVTFDILTHEPQTNVNAHTRTYSQLYTLSPTLPLVGLRAVLVVLFAVFQLLLLRSVTSHVLDVT